MDPFIIAQTVDLAGENPAKTYRQPLAAGDRAAHRWEVRIVRGGQAADLTGCTAAVMARREGEDSIPTVRQPAQIAGNVASAEFIPEVYALGGRILAVMAISGGDGRVITAAVLRMQGKQYTTDSISDPEGTIPSLEALLARYNDLVTATEAARAATQDAQAATEETRAALGDAQQAVAQAQAAVEDAQGALTTAQTAADTAGAAAGKIDNMTVSATPAETGTATAQLSTVDGHYHLALGLPKGDTGATPRISVQVQTGAAGSEASVSVSGTAEEPVIHLTIPRGDTGRIENLTINGKPVESGTITLTAEDVGAVTQPTGEETPGEAPALNAGTFGGMTVSQFVDMIYPVGSIYISSSATSPEMLFGGTWEQLKDRFLLGAGDSYAAGGTGGEENVTLTVEQLPEHYHSNSNKSTTGTWHDADGNTSRTKVQTNENGDVYTLTKAKQNGWIWGYNTGNVGGNQPHNNMPPYLAVYMWQRTA